MTSMEPTSIVFDQNHWKMSISGFAVSISIWKKKHMRSLSVKNVEKQAKINQKTHGKWAKVESQFQKPLEIFRKVESLCQKPFENEANADCEFQLLLFFPMVFED